MKDKRFREFRAGHLPRLAKVGGVEWTYLCGGRGPCIVLLPGGLFFAETWYRAIGDLERDMRVIAITYGAMETMEDCLAGVLSVLEAENAETVHLLGTSFGGLVAQSFVRKHPDRVANLILGNTMGLVPYPPPLIEIKAMGYRLLPEILVRRAQIMQNHMTLAAPRNERSFWTAFWREMMEGRSVRNDQISVHRCVADYRRKARFSPSDLTGWSGGILILESDDDPAIPRRSRETLRRLYPSARVHTFHGAGHTTGYLAPSGYLAVIRSFLEERA